MPFRWGLGHVALEFAATLAQRFGQPTERLREPSDLESWLAEAGFARSTSCDERVLADARKLREAVYRVLDAARRDGRPDHSDIELINACARQPVRAPQIAPDLARASTGPDAADAALAELARQSVELITGPDLQRVRTCANEHCSLLFIDRSRPGRRRWCSMDRCGNRSKTARYRHRRRAIRTTDLEDNHEQLC
jgi:predicted RNA-binding Zn ribbon-like protein